MTESKQRKDYPGTQGRPAIISIEYALDAGCGKDRQIYVLGSPRTEELDSWWRPTLPAGGGESVSVEPLDMVIVDYHKEPTPHLHYVGHGLSNLYDSFMDEEDEEEAAEDVYSGFGFELTMRVAAPDFEPEGKLPHRPTSWICDYASYVIKSGRCFFQWQWVDSVEPLFDGTLIEGFGFVYDPQLNRIDSASGQIEMLQFVGLTRGEIELCTKWKSSRPVIEALELDNPLLINDFDRSSIAEDQAKLEWMTARAVELGLE